MFRCFPDSIEENSGVPMFRFQTSSSSVPLVFWFSEDEMSEVLAFQVNRFNAFFSINLFNIEMKRK